MTSPIDPIKEIEPKGRKRKNRRGGSCNETKIPDHVVGDCPANGPAREFDSAEQNAANRDTTTMLDWPT